MIKGGDVVVACSESFCWIGRYAHVHIICRTAQFNVVKLSRKRVWWMYLACLLHMRPRPTFVYPCQAPRQSSALDNSMDQNLPNGHASAPQTVPAAFEKPSSPPPPPPELVTPPPPPEDFLPPPPEDFPPPPEDLPPPPPPSNPQPPPPPAQPRKIKPKKTSPDSKPLSVEEILRKKKKADEAAAKVRAYELLIALGY